MPLNKIVNNFVNSKFKKLILCTERNYYTTFFNIFIFYIPQSIDSPPAEPSEVEVPHHWVS